MSIAKKQVRQAFRDAVFARDGFCCRACGYRPPRERVQDELDAHHITDRSLMPNGGYVPENGISLCKLRKEGVPTCHERAESGIWLAKTLYALIDSSEELAREKSEAL